MFFYYLLDTSFLIRQFDKKNVLDKEFVRLLNQPGVVLCICGMILAEYSSGKNRNLDSLCFFKSNKKIYLEAGKLFKKLALKGKKIPLSDCIIASYAMFYNAVLITCDQHFRRFKNLKLKLVQ